MQKNVVIEISKDFHSETNLNGSVIPIDYTNRKVILYIYINQIWSESSVQATTWVKYSCE